MIKRKRVVIVSDLHCGHLSGLTPPTAQMRHSRTGNTWQDKVADLEKEAWDWYEAELAKLQPVDIAIVNADCIDGRGERSGSTELLTSDRNRQCDMAVECLSHIRAKDYVMTYGTPYHVSGDGEDFEDNIAKMLRKEKGVRSVKIGSHEWVSVNGLVFDIKHKIGGSSIPHGRFTALARDQVWNQLWTLHDEQPKGQVFVRSHVHFHTYCGNRDWLAVTTPALQTMGTKYGGRQCSGMVDFGFLHFDVESDGSYSWESHTAKLKRQKARVLEL